MSQSPNGWEDAAQGAVNEANKMLRSIRSISSRISPLKWTTAKITNYRVNAKVTFDLDGGEVEGKDLYFGEIFTIWRAYCRLFRANSKSGL